MARPKRYALKGRIVFPVEGPPIRDGYVAICGTEIRSVGVVSPDCATFDLGNVAILPGFVNAHVHLEFSDLTQPLGEPGMGIAEWIPHVLAYRRQSDPSTLADRIARGVRESLRHGTTTLGEITTDPWLTAPDSTSNADVVAFLEILGRDSGRNAKSQADAVHHLDAASNDDRWHAGLSPHAPYTVSRAMLDEAIQLANARSIPIAMHLAESAEEIAYLTKGEGPLAELMASHGEGAAEFTSVGEVVERLSKADRALIIHGNYLNEYYDDRSIPLLQRHADRMTVIYCPRTHAYFGHRWYPLGRFLATGVNVALGTDGRSSNPDLSLLTEMRFVAGSMHDLPGELILELGTMAGAIALGRDHHVGSLRPGKDANLAIVALPSDVDPPDPHTLLFDSDLPNVVTVYRGLVVYQHDEMKRDWPTSI